MAYTAVPTKATGDDWAHTDHNIYIRDNFAAGVPDIFTTKGDIAAATAADTASRLAAGTNYYYFTPASGEATGLKYKILGSTLARYYFSAGVQTVPNTTDTIVNFDTQDFDPGADVTTGAAWKYTAPTTGYYLVCFSLLWASNSWAENEYIFATLNVNGSSVGRIAFWAAQGPASAGFNAGISGSSIAQLSATDYIDIRANQGSGGNLDILNDSDGCWIAIARIA